MIKISVIVPVYNVEEYIRTCVDSLIGQSYQNLEIVLVDDGSTDASGRICDEYAQTDARVTVIHKGNGGSTSARKAGVQCVTGDYVTFVDSDDWIDLDAYEILAGQIESRMPDVVAYGYRKEYGAFSDERQESLPAGTYFRKDAARIITEHINYKYFFYKPVLSGACWAKLIKRELLLENQLNIDNKIRIGEDSGVMYPCIWQAQSLMVIDRSFYHYRVRAGSTVHIRTEEEYDNCKRLIAHYVNHLGKLTTGNCLPMDKVLKQLLYCTYYNLLLTAPDKILEKSRDKLVLYPDVERNSKIVIYGKGAFSNGLQKWIDETYFCEIAACVDKTSKDLLRSRSIGEFDYVIIAVTISDVVKNALRELSDLGIPERKIQYIRSEVLTKENLPEDMVHYFDSFEQL